MPRSEYVYVCHHGMYEDKYVAHIVGARNTLYAIHPDLLPMEKDGSTHNDKWDDDAVTVTREPIVRRARTVK